MVSRLSLPEKMAAFALAQELFKPLPKVENRFPLSPARYCGCLTPPWNDCDCNTPPDAVTPSIGGAP